MEYVKGIANYSFNKPAAVTVGKMDALHRGHRHLIKKITERSAGGDVLSVVVIFDVSPRIKLKKDREPKSVITGEERIKMLEGLGVDVLVELIFDETMVKMEPEDFILMLKERLNMTYLAVGEDFRFGYKGRGDSNLIKDLSNTHGFTFESVEKLKSQGEVISSTLIRNLIRNGDMEKANDLLGYDFSMSGSIVHGQSLGRILEYPTINVEPHKDKIYPPLGVYATSVSIDGNEYFGITNMGTRPTVAGNQCHIMIETFLFNFEGDVYGKHAKINFKKFLRHEQRFGDLSLLKEQIKKDAEVAMKYFGLQA